jgi:hypothetical protein
MFTARAAVALAIVVWSAVLITLGAIAWIRHKEAEQVHL